MVVTYTSIDRIPDIVPFLRRRTLVSLVQSQRLAFFHVLFFRCPSHLRNQRVQRVFSHAGAVGSVAIDLVENCVNPDIPGNPGLMVSWPHGPLTFSTKLACSLKGHPKFKGFSSTGCYRRTWCPNNATCPVLQRFMCKRLSQCLAMIRLRGQTNCY